VFSVRIFPHNSRATQSDSQGFFPSNEKRFSPSIGTDFSLVSEDFSPSLEYGWMDFSPTTGHANTDFSPSIFGGSRRRFREERRRFVSPRDFYSILLCPKEEKNFCYRAVDNSIRVMVY
jgi:hypothetical protein